MIALLAALPLETELLRRRLAPCEVRDCSGFELYRGRLFGQALSMLHCGVGKANAAAAATTLLLGGGAEAVLLLGCGGAYPESGLAVGDLVLATEEVYGDEGVQTADGFLDMASLGFSLVQHGRERYYNRFPLDPLLLERARPLLEGFCADSGNRFACGPCVTVSTCSGTAAAGEILARRTGGLCENMEGAAVAQVCARFGVPLLELRGISNLVEDRDLSRWNLPAGAAAAQEGALALLEFWQGGEEPA